MATIRCPNCNELTTIDDAAVRRCREEGTPRHFKCGKCGTGIKASPKDGQSSANSSGFRDQGDIRDSGLRGNLHNQSKRYGESQRSATHVQPATTETSPHGGQNSDANNPHQELLEQSAKGAQDALQNIRQGLNTIGHTLKAIEDTCNTLAEFRNSHERLREAVQIAHQAASALDRQRIAVDAACNEQPSQDIGEIVSQIKNQLFSPGMLNGLFESYYHWLLKQGDEKQRLKIVADLPELCGYVERELNRWRDASIHDGVPEAERSRIVKILEGIDRRMVEWCARYGIRRFPEPNSIFDPARHEKKGTEETDDPAYYDRIKEVQESGYVFGNEAVLGDRKAKVVVWIRRGTVGS